VTASSEAPSPPLELATRVFTVTGFNSDPMRAYEEMGAQTRQALERVLPDDWSFEGKRVLDFGSGAGRTLRHFLGEAESAEFWGTDIDRPSIEWLDANLCPPLHAWQAEHRPPLGLEHGSFDLIWAISVFTHLTDNSTAWLLEMHRLLKPGGLMIATFMGGQNYEYFAGEPWEPERVGRASMFHTRAWDDGGPVVFMSEWWVREHWGRAFEVVEIAPQIHDMSWAVLRKRDVELTDAELDAPADYPKEYAAALNNLRLARKESLQLEQALAAERAKVHAEFEDTVSWKVTRPLRALGASVRRRRAGR
jgi:SAM-dependent methyltransferase